MQSYFYLQKKSIFVALVMMLLPMSAQSLPQDTIRAESIVKQFMEETAMPGLSITVMVNGGEYWSKGFGYADLENNIKVTPDTKMRVGSISKSMTATAIAAAVEKGKVDIEKTVQDYMENYPFKDSAITLHQLGGHIGGIRGYKTKSEQWVYRHYDSITESLTIFENDPLVAYPGDEFHYSSYGYTLLSAAIESATKMDFLPFMDRYLWQSLGMNNSGQDNVKKIVPLRSRQYRKDEGGNIINAAYVDDSYKIAGSGMLSSSVDLALMGNALVTNGFLNEASKELLFNSQKTNDEKLTGYGFGWYVDMHKFLDARKDKIPSQFYTHLSQLFENRQLIWHSGTASGATAILMLVPETQVVVAITTNLEGVEAQLVAVAMEIEAIFSTKN